jgi:hypothetical protein
MFLKDNPWTGRRRGSRVDHEQAAMRQGHIAVNSILRDWIKGQITAVECGILSFEAVFMPYMLGADGQPLIDKVKARLAAAAEWQGGRVEGGAMTDGLTSPRRVIVESPFAGEVDESLAYAKACVRDA